MAMLNNQRVIYIYIYTVYIYICYIYIYKHAHTHTHYLYVYSRSIKQMMLKLKWWMTRVSVKAQKAELILRRAHPGRSWLMSFCHQWSISCQYIFIHHPLLSVVPPCWQKIPDLLGITWLCYHFGCVNHEYSQKKPCSIQPLIIPRLGNAKNRPLKSTILYPLVMSK